MFMLWIVSQFSLFCFPSVYVLLYTSLCCSFKISNCPVWIHFCCCCIVFVYMCLSVPSTRHPHNPASIHHSPPTSHTSRSYCSIRHPRLRPHSHWQPRYSTTPLSSTTPSACYCIFPLPSYFPLSYYFSLSYSTAWRHWELEKYIMTNVLPGMKLFPVFWYCVLSTFFFLYTLLRLKT